MRKLLAHLEVFDTVGGLYHLDERQRRAVTAEVSSESAEFVVLDRPTLDALAAEWKAQEEGEKAAFLCEEIPVFNGVQPAVMAGLAPYFEKIQVPKDTVVYRQQVCVSHTHVSVGICKCILKGLTSELSPPGRGREHIFRVGGRAANAPSV
jgi:hypothetical protein